MQQIGIEKNKNINDPKKQEKQVDITIPEINIQDLQEEINKSNNQYIPIAIYFLSFLLFWSILLFFIFNSMFKDDKKKFILEDTL